ncbi:piggyBac transposable element-derived protein 4-like [Hyperolius riggenbachi]|uniref:piggyBac transposable element-derived protein 4-like n=1 Tax=Hyperolius riggenbachi TaxID=752182 RepID=UPI0035A2D2FF
MAKRFYSAEEEAAILQEDSNSSSEFEEELSESDIDWLPESESESDLTDSDSESAGPSTAQQSRSEGQTRDISDTDTASEGGSPVPTSSNANPRENFLQYVCEQTNIYANQRIAKKPTSVLAAHWTPVTTQDLKMILGLIFNMALCPNPEQQMYWTKNPIHCIPIYSAKISRRRFQMLLTCLHFSNNDDDVATDNPAHNRLFKLRPFIDHLNKVFAEAYVPEQKIAIDESLIPYHGRLAIKQYIPSKRSWYGIKLYKLCESGSGYTLKLKIYEGKDRLIQPPGCTPYMGTTERIVLDLLNPLLHQGYHLYEDIFYISVPLFKHLFSVQTQACGTVRTNRKGLPAEVVHKKLKRGETFSQRSNDLLALKFKDKWNVLALTTIHFEETRMVRSRTQEIVKPLPIMQYNKFMGAVDLSDQALSPYRLDRKRKIWYKKSGSILLSVVPTKRLHHLQKIRQQAPFLRFQEAVITTLLFESGQPAPNQLHAKNIARYYITKTHSDSLFCS